MESFSSEENSIVQTLAGQLNLSDYLIQTAKATMKAMTKLRKLDTKPMIANPLPLLPLGSCAKSNDSCQNPKDAKLMSDEED